ncbi:hypothetical protein JFL43_16170 [Viridibacillus sp. YIM B01967]|uniref:Fe3+ hydroxamate ABC transporter substrate-binding protein n=1 Tax=Viridibacillus soli TaxID=2798301 RepID=A0ABS1HAC5_9BACL|nr:hypothetical protein [Viridibacillus soli]MBK3496367.1 hypothetical protein [Viridibacillus soli]
MFGNNKALSCSSCNKQLGEGDRIHVSLTLPSERMMPVGVLNKVLQKHANTVYCEKCNSKLIKID